MKLGASGGALRDLLIGMNYAGVSAQVLDKEIRVSGVG